MREECIVENLGEYFPPIYAASEATKNTVRRNSFCGDNSLFRTLGAISYFQA